MLFHSLFENSDKITFIHDIIINQKSYALPLYPVVSKLFAVKVIR